jgi:hypothetical protein
MSKRNLEKWNVLYQFLFTAFFLEITNEDTMTYAAVRREKNSAQALYNTVGIEVKYQK